MKRLIFVLAIIIVGILFRDGLLKASGESGLPFYNISRSYNLFSSTWSDLGLGNSSNIGTAVIPTFWFFKTLHELGFSPYYQEYIFFVLAFAASGMAIYELNKIVVPNISKTISLAVVLFYWFNPLAVVNVWNRFLYNYMVLYAFLPYAMYLFLTGLKNKKYSHALIFGVSSVFFSYAFTSMPSLILAWGCLALVTIFMSRKQSKFSVCFFLLALVSFLICNAWWLSQVINIYTSVTYVKLVGTFFTNTGNLGTLKTLSEVLGRYSDVLFLMHHNFYNIGPFWAGIYSLPVLKIISALPVVISIWTTIAFRKNKLVVLLGVIFTLSLFLAKGSLAPFGDLFAFVFTHSTVAQLFRNPFEKIGFLLPLAISPLLALGLSSLSKNIKIVGLISLVVFGVYFGFPFWSGYILTANKYDNQRYDLRSVTVSVPDDYQAMDKFMRENSISDRVLTLPLGGEGLAYTWEHPYWGVELTNSLLPISSPSFNTTIPYYGDFVNQLTKYQLSPEILSLLKFAGIKYILLRADVDFANSHVANPKVTRKFLTQLEDNNDIKLIYRVGDLTLYKVNQTYTNDHFYMASDLHFINTANFPKNISNQGVLFYANDSLRINSSLNFPVYIYPNGKYQSSDSSIINETDETLLGRLFYVKYLPDSWQYQLALLKEKLEYPQGSNIDDNTTNMVNLMGKRTVEIYRVLKLNPESKNLASTINQYSSFLNSLKNLLNQGGSLSSASLQSLEIQQEIFSRLHLVTSAEIINTLSDYNFKPRYPVDNTNYATYKFVVGQTGNYKLVYVGEKAINAVYINGVLNTASNSIHLENGQYEIAIPVGDSYNQNVYSVDNQIVSTNKILSWDTTLSNIPQTYTLVFDYKFVKGNEFKIKILQDIDRPDAPVWNHSIHKDASFHDWRHVEDNVTFSPGASHIDTAFIPQKENLCERDPLGLRKCSTLNSDFEVEIRDLSFKIKDDQQPYLENVGLPSNPPKTTDLEWHKLSSTEYQVSFRKTSITPEVLVFSELFDSRWQLSGADAEHFLVNMYANGWLFDKPGSYQLKLRFSPQSWLNYSKWISASSIGLVLLCLLFTRYKKL